MLTKKEKIFNLYSRNLSWLKSNEKVRFEPDFEDGYICPLCIRVFPRDALYIHTESELTIDHNPPESMGGKETILTCRECNSTTGSLLDAHLLKRLEEHDVLNLTPNAQKRVTILNEGKNINGVFHIDKDKVLNIKVNERKTNPKDSQEFFKKLRQEDWDGFKFNLNFKIESRSKYAETALLKIAYLKAFKFFGNGFLMNPFLYAIRDQILSPEKSSITEPFSISFSGKSPLGIAIISEPKELQSFMVSFELKTKNKSHFFSILLPGFSSPGLAVYENLKKLSPSKNIKFKMNILEDANYLVNESSVFESQRFWQSGICS